MKVLMLGWELPPFFAGGVGMVCNELARELTSKGVEIIYVMPNGPKNLKVSHINRIIVANNILPEINIKIRTVNSLLGAYQSQEDYSAAYNRFLKESKDTSGKPLYGKNIIEEVYRFAAQVALIAQEEDFDVIHAHDWTTFPAAIAAKKATGKPMFAHVHITEFDKSGGLHANPDIYRIEKLGMDESDIVIAVSEWTKKRCIESYFTDPNKIRVVHNAAIAMDELYYYDGGKLKERDKIVLFAGRVTLQKGPDYFVDAAKIVLDHNPNVTFIIAGTGDMLPRIIEKAAHMGISHKFVFHGFYNREEAEKFFSMADVFVMPSVSEPFGVVPYEAQIKKTPSIISRQSGISEVMRHCLKVDFWDVQDIAAKILALISYPTLNKTLAHNGYLEAKTSNWDKPARKCIELYQELAS